MTRRPTRMITPRLLFPTILTRRQSPSNLRGLAPTPRRIERGVPLQAIASRHRFPQLISESSFLGVQFGVLVARKHHHRHAWKCLSEGTAVEDVC